MSDLVDHPQLQTVSYDAGGADPHAVQMVAPAVMFDNTSAGDEPQFGGVPPYSKHTEQIWAEFATD